MGRHGVARIGAAAAPAWAALLLPPLLLLLAGARAGLTSEYRRHLGSAIDMPLDADVFRPPPGHNAPEQVRTPQCATVRSSRLLLQFHKPLALHYSSLPFWDAAGVR
jgi:hypothetical protein